MIYIGQIICLYQRIQDHNSGNGSNTTQPEYLRPFILMAYICGFGGGCKQLREHIEYERKVRQNRLITNGILMIQEYWLDAVKILLLKLTRYSIVLKNQI